MTIDCMEVIDQHLSQVTKLSVQCQWKSFKFHCQDKKKLDSILINGKSILLNDFTVKKINIVAL